jgi:molybdenum cofactor cytidylyltransferase
MVLFLTVIKPVPVGASRCRMFAPPAIRLVYRSLSFPSNQTLLRFDMLAVAHYGAITFAVSRRALHLTSAISAIILAAGYSRRMGALKPLLKLGDGTVLERVIGLFSGSGINDVIVVVGHGASHTIPIAHQCGAQAVMNRRFDQGMFSSVQEGVRALSPDSLAFFMLPVDIPLVRPQTIEELLEAYYRGMGKIVFPAFLGKRGHPPLVDTRYRDEILAHPGEGGLRAILRNHEDQSIEIEVADEMILFDLDTPADYEAVVARFT